MSKKLTNEEIDRWSREVEEIQIRQYPKTDVTRAIEYMLYLHDILDRISDARVGLISRATPTNSSARGPHLSRSYRAYVPDEFTESIDPILMEWIFADRGEQNGGDNERN